LGRRTALVLAYFLALSPTLIAVTRTADGKAIGLDFPFTGLGPGAAASSGLARICAGQACWAGASVWLGLLGLAVAGGFSIPWCAACGRAKQSRPAVISGSGRQPQA
jgi:hypothetical protein